MKGKEFIVKLIAAGVMFAITMTIKALLGFENAVIIVLTMIYIIIPVSISRNSKQ